MGVKEEEEPQGGTFFVGELEGLVMQPYIRSNIPPIIYDQNKINERLHNGIISTCVSDIESEWNVRFRE